MVKKAVILLSGGLDSAVVLYYAKSQGYSLHCLTFNYGQRHVNEIKRARTLAGIAGAEFIEVRLPFSWKGSSLVDRGIALPCNRTLGEIHDGIPSTYVPARNTIFLSIAASFAETISAGTIFIGAHFEDSSGYPDCRREYLEAFDRVVKLGTRAGLEGRLKIDAPLIDKSKKDIIKLGALLGVPFYHAWSCYAGGEKPCMACDSCILRAKGFKEAGLHDPLLEAESIYERD